MARLLGIDTGGTYTDAVIFEQDAGPAAGVVAAAKALTTKHDLAVGVREAIEAVLPEAAAEIALVSLSTTLATNAVVEGQGSPVCLLLIGTGPEVLERSNLRQALAGDPVAFIPGGHRASGDEQAPLDLEAARAAIRQHAPKVAAFVVAGYFGVRNPAHEAKLRDMIHEETGLPVTCGHELTTNLDAPRRAVTAVLNGRLIPLLQQLILAVRDLMTEKGIAAPLMVVQGDGSLISAEAALTRPIETILSGPAASVIGARYLSGEDDVIVSDMGGTTTDIAVLRDGRPALDLEGATVGGWRTMVEAVAVHTFGLGGDSELRLDDHGRLVLGPRRAVPLALLARDTPAALETLRVQAARGESDPGDGRFALRLRPLDAATTSLSSGETRVWQKLSEGPVALEVLLADHHLERPLRRLVDRGLVIVSAFTPSDAAHVLGLQEGWNAEAARLGAELWRRRLAAAGLPDFHDAEAFARRVFDQVVVQSGKALAASALAEERAPLPGPGERLGELLVERALAGNDEGGGDPPLLGAALVLGRPIVAIGAPAATYYPAVAARLGTRATVPPHAGVTNAVGAVASGVARTVKALITAPDDQRYRVHMASGVRDFPGLAPARDYAAAEARRLAAEQAREAGAGQIDIRVDEDERIVTGPAGDRIFVESEVVATAVGRPRLAGA
ncbi:MAG: hydantoinase/oxoprolinase family protein [Rhodospirillales bacterium]|nr:hydantoinase/oxoprolinase family protein [Rhodospirillales bacterium]